MRVRKKVERWLESFEDRARVAGWSPEQSLYQFKSHLSKTALQAFRFLLKKDKSEYELAVAAMKKRFTSVDIEELHGVEFHSLVQENQSAEQLGLELQRLAHKAFPSLSGDDLDRMLKGRFYTALLPKWQKKLGAPRPTEKFNDLYERARTLERHDKQFQASAASRTEKTESSPKPSSKPPSVDKATESNASGSQKSSSDAGTGQSAQRPVRICYLCRRPGHLARNCHNKKRFAEARGRSQAGQGSQSKVSVVEASSVVEGLTTQQLEDMLADRRLQEEESELLKASSSGVNVIISSPPPFPRNL